MKIGFVGNGTDKFTELGQERAKEFIAEQLWFHDQDIACTDVQVEAMVSGHSPVGGIDIWAEEAALAQGIALDLKVPEVHQWNPEGGYGYKARNLDIAKDSDILYIVLADRYPEEYQGRRFAFCYHHNQGAGHPAITPDNHVKSGGCWTGKEGVKLGKDVRWHIINNN